MRRNDYLNGEKLAPTVLNGKVTSAILSLQIAVTQEVNTCQIHVTVMSSLVHCSPDRIAAECPHFQHDSGREFKRMETNMKPAFRIVPLGLLLVLLSSFSVAQVHKPLDSLLLTTSAPVST